MKKQLHQVSVKNVTVNDSFWSQIQNLVMDVVIPYQADILEDKVPGAEKSRAIENFRIAAGEAEGEFYGMVFQDSDLAKWLEGVAYALALRPNPEMEKKADEVIALIGKAQEEDGYLNTYFTLKEPEHKWQNLQECHELYCSGHMIEAAVAYYQTTGKTALLDIMKKNADLICERFGYDKVWGVPGHQEIELALIRLYRATGEEKYLDTAKYFIEERGKDPDFFQEESKRIDWRHFGMDAADREYAQNHAPVRQQDKAVGHSVRAVYMYTAMADLAAETGDKTLYDACKVLWENIVNKRMYVTGGIGSTVHGEAFSADYELPNDLVYAETCASISMAFFAGRMLEIEPKGEYADILEKELYNGILSGMQLDGKRFFYVNPLEVVPGVSGKLKEYKHVLPERPGWYACACCPPNVVRLVTSLGQYAWGENENSVFAHTYLGGTAAFENGAQITCQSNYPWSGDISYTIDKEKEFTFAIHLPGWCKNYTLQLNGTNLSAELKDGYLYITRLWKQGDQLTLSLDIQPRRLYANTHVRANAGCVALARGPVVYCIEEKDNGPSLSALRLPRNAPIQVEEITQDKIGTTTILSVKGVRLDSGDALYEETPPTASETTITALPYYKWGNRGAGEMRVW
ncbi:MAG: glycoside hydrolase family 127 protein, partial [Clostridiales bacterium]|nr:glycoside hydrolase family 127 protein [Clostridiales bacterium]